MQLKVEFEEAKKIEDMLLQEIKDNTREQEQMEEEVVRLRKKIENAQRKVSTNSSQTTSSSKLNKILDTQGSPMIKTGIGYEGESSKSKEKENREIIFVKAKKNDEAAQTIPTKEETCNEEDRDQKKPLVVKNVINTKTSEKGTYASEYVKFGIHQRRVFPPMKNSTCYLCHKLGNITAYFHARRSNSNQKKMQTLKRLPQANKWKRQPYIRYANSFYGYYFYCKEFGHKIIECRKYGQRLMLNTSRRFMNQRNFVHTHNSAKIIIK